MGQSRDVGRGLGSRVNSGNMFWEWKFPVFANGLDAGVREKRVLSERWEARAVSPVVVGMLPGGR